MCGKSSYLILLCFFAGYCGAVFVDYHYPLHSEISTTSVDSSYQYNSVQLSTESNAGSQFQFVGPLAPAAYAPSANAYLTATQATESPYGTYGVQDSFQEVHRTYLPPDLTEPSNIPQQHPNPEAYRAYLPPAEPTEPSSIPNTSTRPEVYHNEFFSFEAPTEKPIEVPNPYNDQQSVVHKHHRVIFIKSPEQPGVEQTLHSLATAQAQPEKTAIYVFNKAIDPNYLTSKFYHLQQQQQQLKPTKPEVNFINYNNAEQAAYAEQAIRAKYEHLAAATPTKYHPTQTAPVIDFPEHWHFAGGAAAGLFNVPWVPAQDAINSNQIDNNDSNSQSNDQPAANENEQDNATESNRVARLMHYWPASENHIQSRLNERFRPGSKIVFPTS